ncbi:hypothetical protein AB0C69_42035, partial [Actinomadura sp. NPDC048032]|uniref:hypothetical protein n=1 Tax=Actinomadura sp. NPDC048032 TaxID=3155747 RepID=UPI00340ED56F
MRRTAAALATVLTAGLAAGVQAAAAAEPPTCGTPADHQIAEIQGSGGTTPLAGQTSRSRSTNRRASTTGMSESRLPWMTKKGGAS